MGMLGMHGTWYSNMAVHFCDVLIAVGSQVRRQGDGERGERLQPEAKKIHIDIDPSAISKNVPVDVPIVGDVKRVLTALQDLVNPLDTKDWLRTIDAWKDEHPLRYRNGEEIRAQYVIQKLGEITGGNAIVVTDVGQHQMWAAQFFNYSTSAYAHHLRGPRDDGVLAPGGHGGGFGRSDLPVISISGDGGFQMNSFRKWRRSSSTASRSRCS
jgi:acetolactate synthase-1/2/3 large subunit